MITVQYLKALMEEITYSKYVYIYRFVYYSLFQELMSRKTKTCTTHPKRFCGDTPFGTLTVCISALLFGFRLPLQFDDLPADFPYRTATGWNVQPSWYDALVRK